MLLELKNISKDYVVGDTKLSVLDSFNGYAESGEFIALVGPSGAGKSTLMHIIGGLDNATSGEVIFNGVDIAKFKNSELDKYRGEELGFVFQFHHLLDDFTAIENIMLPHLVKGGSEDEARKRALALLDEIGLLDRMQHFPKELSGGEQQRIALARAMVNQPKLLLADEPTGNLDKKNSDTVIKILKALAKKSNVCVIIVTHDEDIAQIADRQIRLNKK